MAERFGGRYSPGGTPKGGQKPAPGGAPFGGRKASNINPGARMMFIAPFSMLIGGVIELVSGQPVDMLVELGGFALTLGGAVLLSEGLKAEAAYAERTIAKPPEIPRKLFAAVATGLGVGLVAGFADQITVLEGILFGGAALAAHLVAFGLDPMRAKGGAGSGDLEADRVARAIDRAEGTVEEILAAIRRTRDRALIDRVGALMTPVREVFRMVEEDPRDLSRARKFLGVYLIGARDATVKYAKLTERGPDAEARTEYEALLGDLETSFQNQQQVLLQDDRSALDVEIEVLRDRLQREGIKPNGGQ